MSNSADIFWTDIMLTGLGAIMDVAVTIVLQQGKLSSWKNPDVSQKKIHHIQDGKSDMTLWNHDKCAAFVLASGMIPMFILKMNNEIRFYNDYTISYSI